MKTPSLLALPVLWLALTLASPARAESPSVLLEQRLKASYNTLVQDVRATKEPRAQRALIRDFLTRLDRGLNVVDKVVPASGEDHAEAARMRARIQADLVALNGIDVHASSAGADLNAFASFLQQDAEQADGIFLSAGAIIIILLIVILVL